MPFIAIQRYEVGEAEMPRHFWQYSFVRCGGKAGMTKWHQSSHYPQPIECTQI